MKNTLTIIIILFLLIGCGNLNFDRVPIDQIDKASMEKAKILTEKMLEAQKKGGYYKLNNQEAITKMVYGYNSDTQKSSYDQIKGVFGEYEGIEFDHLLKPKDGTLHKIYRFKGKFSSSANVEVRTVLDGQNKLAGFFVKKWKENI